MFNINRILFLITALTMGVPHLGMSDVKPSSLISSTKISELPFSTISSFVGVLGQPQLAGLLKYGVRSYRIVYETNWKNTSVKASGLVLVPIGIEGPAPIISVQHGTTFSKDDIPSAGDYTGMELFASAGFIVVMPDYLGYGTSSEIFHPYYDKYYSAQTVIDMITSSKEFLQKEKVAYNTKLFLAGYSEGGFVTMAAAEEIERNPKHELDLSGVAAGAGGYDLMHMLQGVSTKDYYSYPAYLAFVLMSYDKTYEWNRPLSYYFRSKYGEVLSRYMTGSHGGWSINSKLTTDLPALFSPEFYAGLKKSEGEVELKQALKKNTIKGWKTSTPIRFYHGTADEIIPYSNSEATLTSFHHAGSKQVTLTPINRGTHGSSLVPMLQHFVPWFIELM